MNEQWTIAIDLDGVLADFEGKVSEINGMPFSAVPRGKLWASIGHYDKTVGPFFESLNKTSDADELWEYVKANFINVFILSAAGFTPRNGAEQKKAWVAKHFGIDVVTKVVSTSSDKAAFATANTILIDDRSKSIDPWVAAGGIGVLHRTSARSIAQLKEIVEGA